MTVTLEEGMRARLLGHTGLSAIIGTRVFEGVIPQGEVLPCITYSRISTARHHAHDTSGSSGLATVRIQIDAWARVYSVARSITDQVRAALNGFRGNVTVGASTIMLQAALVDEERADHEPEIGLSRLMSDYLIWHEEA